MSIYRLINLSNQKYRLIDLSNYSIIRYILFLRDISNYQFIESSNNRYIDKLIFTNYPYIELLIYRLIYRYVDLSK